MKGVASSRAKIAKQPPASGREAAVPGMATVQPWRVRVRVPALGGTGLVAPSSAGDDVFVVPIAQGRVSDFRVIDLLLQVRQRLAREDLEELFIT